MITKNKAIETLKQCHDPELGLDVWTLGLIYKLDIKGEDVNIDMTFTTPLCPYGPMLVGDVRAKLLDAGAKNVTIEIVFKPPWQPSEEVKDMLGIG